MFKCGNCNTSTQPRQPVNYVILEKREKVYENTIFRGSYRGELNVSQGNEIVKQIEACPGCFGKLTGLAPKMVEVRVAPLREENKVERPKFKPRHDFNKPRRPIDKTNPNWKYKQELDEIKKREAQSPDPRGDIQRKKPVVEVVNRPLRG